MPFRPALLALLIAPAPALAAGPLEFERIVIDDNFPGGYQVEVADVNGDKKPDIVALGGSTLAWYENPLWTKRIIGGKAQTPDIISSATADLDGDGKAEVAVAYDFAMNEPTRGRLLLAVQGKTSDDPWTIRTIADVPSIHRLRWGDLDGDRHPELVVAPIFGRKPQAPPKPARDPRPDPRFPPKSPPDLPEPDATTLAVYSFGIDPKLPPWPRRLSVSRFGVIHAIEVLPEPGRRDGRWMILTADKGGVHVVRDGRYYARSPVLYNRLIPGATGPGDSYGSSEVHLGKLADGRFFLATIDPWHGSEVAVCVSTLRNTADDFGPRTVLDDTLSDGHALWVADVDKDGTDEVFAGHRGQDARVSVYRFDGKTWARTVLDPNLTAQDLRGGDIDGDGTPDVVAIGGKSHNVVWFRPVRGK